MKVSQKGFTLIELMITVAIIGILAAVAYPSYTQFIIRSNRAGAQAEMMSIASLQQQYLLSNRTYATVNNCPTSTGTIAYSFPSSLTGKYTCNVTVGTDTVPSFTVTFNATGNQSSDGNLTLNNEGVKTPSDKW